MGKRSKSQGPRGQLAPAADDGEGHHHEGRTGTSRPGKYSRRRALMLASVYLLFGLHIAHWKLNGTTLAPLELNELMHTLELGVITAGCLFMATAVLATAVFGRFFCSWGCHILALEDLCGWILEKLRIEPRPVRSRVLFFVPLAAMLYMFAWPQVQRMLAGLPHPGFRIAGDDAGWASFVTQDYWRNLPSPLIALLTFFTCGFALIYFLGSRSFCAYGCPYGVIFGLADRVAPGKIRQQNPCAQCAQCTAVCDSGVRVHEEIATHGMIVDPACLKDLDCVAVCPDDVLAYGFGKPTPMRSTFGIARRKRPYDFTWPEEGLIAVSFLAALLVFRGLYGAVPFLMTLGLGGITAFLAVGTWRLLAKSEAKVGRFGLKRAQGLTRTGWAFGGFVLLWGSFSGHSAFIRYHEVAGERGFEEIRSLVAQSNEVPEGLLTSTIEHARARARWGIARPASIDQQLASLSFWAGAPEEAEAPMRRLLQARPGDGVARMRMAKLLFSLGRHDEAEAEARHVLSLESASSTPELDRALRVEAYDLVAALRARSGDMDGAVEMLTALLELDPSNERARAILAQLRGRR